MVLNPLAQNIVLLFLHHHLSIITVDKKIFFVFHLFLFCIFWFNLNLIDIKIVKVSLDYLYKIIRKSRRAYIVYLVKKSKGFIYKVASSLDIKIWWWSPRLMEILDITFDRSSKDGQMSLELALKFQEGFRWIVDFMILFA